MLVEKHNFRKDFVVVLVVFYVKYKVTLLESINAPAISDEKTGNDFYFLNSMSVWLVVPSIQ